MNPLNPFYLRGFNDGKREAVKEFARRFEQLQHVKGIGPKTIQKMVEVMKLPIKGHDEKGGDKTSSLQ